MSPEVPIKYIAAFLEAMPYFSKVYGLCEHLDNGKGLTPAFYIDGSKQPIYVEINKLGTAYFRMRSPVSISDSQAKNMVSCATLYTATFPLRLIAITKREYFPDNNAYAANRLSGTIIKAITANNGTMRTEMNVRNVMMRARAYSTDIKRLKDEEFPGVSNAQFPLEDIAVGIDIDVVIETYSDCIPEPCEYIPRFCLQLEPYVALP